MVSEDEWEQIALEEFAEHGWEPVSGHTVAPVQEGRESWSESCCGVA